MADIADSLADEKSNIEKRLYEEPRILTKIQGKNTRNFEEKRTLKN